MAATFLSNVPQLLRWCNECAPIGEVLGKYHTILLERFDEFVLNSDNSESECHSLVADAAGFLSGHDLIRILEAPEISGRLLWPERPEATDLPWIFVTATDIYQFRMGRTKFASPGWSAEGDFCMGETSHPISESWVADSLALDFESPYAERLKVGGGPIIDAEQKGRVCDFLIRAIEGVDRIAPSAGQFVRAFTRVVMLRNRNDRITKLVSRSPERRVSLTVIENPLAEGADEADFAEALIHEAIHSVLDLDEVFRRRGGEALWMLNSQLYDGESRAISPWTGSALAVPTFLHACFVWFGLVMFWALAYGSDTFPEHRIRERLLQAIRGFLGPPLTDLLHDFQSDISPELLNMIGTMQSDIQSACLT